LLFFKAKKSIGLDIGTHSVKAVQMSRRGGRLCIDEVGYALVDRNQVNSDPVIAHASAVSEALMGMNLNSSQLVGALPGQTVVIRYPRYAESARDQLEEIVSREAGQNIPYDLTEVSLDWTLLDEVEEAGQRQLKVLLVAAKHENIDSRVQIMDATELEFAVLGVDSLALADAAEACDFLRVGETVALVNIGLTSASIHFVKDGISNFIRDVNWGSRELIHSIAKELRCEYEEAERRLQEFLVESADEATGEEPPPVTGTDPGDPFAVPAVENLNDTLEDSGAAIQTPDSLTDFGDDPFGEAEPASPPSPMSVGGGSLLDPLDDEMDDSFGVQSASPMGMAEEVEPDMRDIVSASLSKMVSEIRRSFDYYEHQLYERPVDRLVVSGGIAHSDMVCTTLLEELGVESVDVANPTSSALYVADDMSMGKMLEQPAQFMVAVGLAARGMADL
jgi:type IV pilus assembly protein PilM